MVHRVQVRPISNDEGMRLLRIVRRGTGSVVTWRRAQMVLLSAQGMPVTKIAEVSFTSPDRVRDVLHNFTADGFDSLYPRYAGGRPPKFDLRQRAQIKQIALSRPHDHDLPFSVWSLAKLADFLVAEGVVDDISHEGLRALLRDEDVSFQAVKSYKASTDPDYDTKTTRVLQLYALADGLVAPGPGDPSVIFCMDEFGPLNLQPHPGKQWALVAHGKGDPAAPRRRRRRATYTRPHGVRHLMAALDLSRDKLYGHIRARKGRTQFLAFCWRNISMRALARRAGIPHSTLAYNLKVENRDRPVGRELIQALARVLPVEEEELVRAAQVAAGYTVQEQFPDLGAAVVGFLGDGEVSDRDKRRLRARLADILLEEMRRADESHS